MSQDLIVSGDTYEGVERVAATNTKGGLVVYGDGDGEASSPTIAVAPIEGGYRITVTDVAGSRSFDMKNGLSPTINITETPFADANGAGSAIKITCVSKDPVTGEETESSETVYVRNGKNGLHGTDVTLDITRQSGDDPGWWFKKKQTVYNADGTTKVTETTDFIPVSDDFVIAKISGSFRDDTLEWEYTVLWGGLPAPAAGLNALVESGKIVIGVADGDLGFRVFADEAYNDYYVVPSGTVFNYNNGTFWFSNFADKDGEIKNMAFAIKAGYKDSPWWGMTYPSQYTIYLTGDQPGRIVECFGRKLEPREAYEILLDAANNDIPLLCYQKDAVFKLADGSTHTPQYGTPFYYDHNTELLHCEHDGYVCTLYVDLDVYKATAEKNTPYKTAESKADDLKEEDGTIFLLSAGEPIGEGIPIPTGDSNVFIGKYDTVTFAEIKAAHDAGKVCFLDFNGISLPLLGVNDTEAMFVREINENTDYRVTITSAGGKDFTIVDKNISDVYVVSLFSAKYAEVKAAYDAGKACFVTYGALLCPLTVLDEEKAEFVGMLTPHLGIKGTVPAEGNPDFTYVRSNAVQTVSQSLSDDQKAQARTNIGAAAAADIATTKYASTSTSSQSIFKISDFGSWGTGAWYQKGFSMLITSRAGETVWFSLSANDSATTARAFRLMNTYSKIAGVYYSVSENAVYVKANAWCNNVTAHILSNIGGDYVPTVASVSGLASDAVEVNIIEFGPTSSGLAVGASSTPLLLGGSATRPTYNGADMALSSDLSSYLPLGGGLMTGSLKFQAASLPGKSLQYICGVDAFASGGEMGWQSKADFLSGYLTTTGTAARATADANGNNIANTYAKVTTANDYNGEQRFKNAAYCPTITDTASGIGCAFKASRGMVNELLADKIIATASTGKIPFYSYTGASNGSMTGLTEFAYLSPGAFILRPPSGEGGQIQLEAAANDPTNTGICIDTAGGNFRIFGLQSADGTTTTGYGSVLAIHPYAKVITGGYSFDGIAAKATADGNGRNIVSTYATKTEVTYAAGGPLIVTVTGNDTNGYAADKTYDEILSAWDSGRDVIAKVGEKAYRYSYCVRGMAVLFSFFNTGGTDRVNMEYIVENLTIWHASVGFSPTIDRNNFIAELA